jgi:hypothetical protein
MVGTGWGGGVDAWTYVTNTNFTGSTTVDVDVDMSLLPGGSPDLRGNCEIVFDSTGHWENEYRLEIWSQDSPAYANRFHLSRYKNGVITELTAEGGNELSPVPIPPRSHITVRRINNTISVYINNVRVKALTDADRLPAEGEVGLGVIWDWTAAFDNFFVRS